MLIVVRSSPDYHKPSLQAVLRGKAVENSIC
jgi:hypothetical protein